MPVAGIACADDAVMVRHGRNVWLIARSDRDAPTREEVLAGACGFLSHFLGPASPLGSRNPLERISPSQGRCIIGAARPIDLTAEHPTSASDALRPRALPGERLGIWTDCDQLRTVQASVPWLVIADFDWRASDVAIPWPRMREAIIGDPSLGPDNALDWLLIEARHAAPQPTREDTALSDELADAARAKAQSAIGGLRTGLALAAAAVGIYWAWSLRPRRGRA